jgi:hypothetical protein
MLLSLRDKLRNPLSPALVTALFLFLVVGWTIVQAGGDPLSLAQLGTRFSQGDPSGSEGYDGQFVYYLARDLNPQTVAAYLDVPAYRYQRILLPLIARMLSLGNGMVLPWVLPLLGIICQASGTWAVARLLTDWGINPWYALVYGLFAGFVLAVRLDLPEPLAYGLIAAGLLARERGHSVWSWLLYGLALFAREVTLVFVIAQIIADLVQRRWRDVFGMSLAAFLPFAIFQGWLWLQFGQPGLATGGQMATAFEWIPYMGLFRIGNESLPYLFAMLVVFGPAVLLPSIWGIIHAGKSWFSGHRNVIVLSLFLNALSIAALPFSTFRETGGLIRFACGLMLAVLLYGGRFNIRRVLNYSPLWLVLNVFLLK